MSEKNHSMLWVAPQASSILRALDFNLNAYLTPISVCGDPFLSREEHTLAASREVTQARWKWVTNTWGGGKSGGIDLGAFLPQQKAGSWLCLLLPSLPQPSQVTARTAPVHRRGNHYTRNCSPKAYDYWAGGSWLSVGRALPGLHEALGVRPNTR